MPEYLQVILLTTLAGGAMPVGGAIARIERLRPDWLEQEFRHSVIAFGGGILLSAVALVLVPEGIKDVSIPVSTSAFLLGGAAFCLLDWALSKTQTSAAQLAAMLADFVPEALALGATFAQGSGVGFLLAFLIAAQNLPEGFNAYRELVGSGRSKPGTVLSALTILVLLGPVAGLIGLWWLASYPTAVSCVMLFAAGGILYLTFQDIAPQVRLEKFWGPPLGAVAGFVFGVIGHQLTM